MQIKNQFDQETLMKILKGAAIAGGAAFGVSLLQGLSTLNFGQLTPTVVAIFAIIINAIREWHKGEEVVG
jgi:ABC-type antimicrobial peptide transport system permease subunit